MEAPQGTSDVALTADELAGLPPRAQLALAVRATWRVLPLAATLDEAALREAAGALVFASAALLDRGGERLGAFRDRSFGRAVDLGEARKSGDPGLAVGGAAYGAAAMARSVEAASPLDTVHALLLIELALGQDEEARHAARDAARDDLSTLDGLPEDELPRLLERPLWLRPEGDWPPGNWPRYMEPFYGAAQSAGLGWLVDQYERLIKGGGLDPELLFSVLEQWRPEEPAEPVEPGPTEDDDILPGGIVVTAADLPAREDHLGRSPLVHTLADMLASPEQALPMTIALLGDWGSGKTSVIEQLKARLGELADQDRRTPGPARRNRYLFATFNAWEYEQTDNLRAGLAQEVVNGLTADLPDWDKLVLAVTKAERGNRWEFWSTVGGLALALLGIIVGYNLATPEDAGQAMRTAELLSGGGLAAFGAYLLINAWRTGRRLLEHPLATQMATYLKLPSYGKHLGEVPVIKKDIRELCKQRLDAIPNGRLLVVVDDLDRCHPAAVTQTLDAIRLVMNLPRVAVIIAVDDRIAFRAVADHYKDLEEAGKRSRWEIARDYLGKIIQLPVNLYDPWPSEVTRFVTDHLFQVSEAAEAEAQAARAARASEPKAPPEPPRLTDAARRKIDSQGLDATLIPGTGQGGQVTLSDVRRYLKAREQQDAVAPPDQAKAVENPALMEAQTRAAGEDEPPVPPSTAAMDALMEDTVPERELFAELTADLGFNNPRQLIRLRNSYRLLKGYRYCRGSVMSWPLLAGLMQGLFWHEYLYQMRMAQREHAELVMWLWGDHPEWEIQAGQRGRNPPVVAMARRLHGLFDADQWGAEYGRLMRTVDLVVLPHAQVGLVLDRPRADALLASKSSGTPLLPDPWGGGFVPVRGKA